MSSSFDERQPMPYLEPTFDEARRMPSFYRATRINKPSYKCEACKEHAKEPWLDGTACDEHKEPYIALAPVANPPKSDPRRLVSRDDAETALLVLRAGGNPEPAFKPGTIAFEQWTYRPKGRKADREATVRNLTRLPNEPWHLTQNCDHPKCYCNRPDELAATAA